ncbi:hypothetical protein PQG98_06880 [Bacteroides zhangwenhongii]|uniref:Uncharacterized protein n=1 Tax=Bacteroides zhangwenhongii TaxID=2650157 RepID=A0ABT5H804_9BACE|nr:hypothetical protein [Bacteroides zhangwenhongii]MDC7136071.1 hypothetical protein [Bacteroides zhangwenhongii]OKZ22425.1 MAG: hypothetical protein BHV74_09495 [Bacteroides finegoldii]
MKNVLITIGKLYLLLTLICFAVGCDDDKEDVAPGLYVASEEIETFPGDTVLVSGTASNYAGLASITLSCEGWGIHKVYDLNGQNPKVFNYDYRLVVPKTAAFEENLLITICDVNGWETKKNVLLTYIADMESPVMQTQLPSRIAVDFNTATNKGSWNLNLKFTDDRDLKSVRMQIPDMQIDETVAVSGRSGELKRTIDFTTGEFPVTLTVTDAGGNETIVNTTVVVMLAEEEDPIQDYPVMWVVNASEKAEDYLDGYYAPMIHKGEYQYEGKFYADKEDFQVFFTSGKTMNGDLFGVSPYVNSKLMNKNGYVVPVTIAEPGYYGVWIDLQAHTYSVWKLEFSTTPYTGSLTISGCGFSDFADWGTSATEMARDGYRYTCTLNQIGGYTATRQYYAARVSDWGYILRYWTSDEGCGWWEDTTNAGGAVCSYTSDYDGEVQITFDTAILWATIKKITE